MFLHHLCSLLPLGSSEWRLRGLKPHRRPQRLHLAQALSPQGPQLPVSDKMKAKNAF